MSRLKNTFYQLIFPNEDPLISHPTVSICDELFVQRDVHDKSAVTRRYYFEISKYDWHNNKHLVETIAESEHVILKQSEDYRRAQFSNNSSISFKCETFINPGLYQGADRIRVYITSCQALSE